MIYPKGIEVRFCAMLAMLLVASFVNAEEPAEMSKADAHFAALNKKVDAAIETWRKEQQEASKRAQEAAKKGEPIPAMSMTPPFSKFIPEFQAGAKEFAGQDGAVQYLLWLCQYGYTDMAIVKSSGDTLIKDHATSAGIKEFARFLPMMSRAFGEEDVAKKLDTLIEKSPHADIRAWAVLSKHQATLEDASIDVASKEYKLAKAAIQKASAATEDGELKGMVKGLIASREQLADGKVAPDIVGVDLDGVAFKLSDYAGKIIMLDFWGDW